MSLSIYNTLCGDETTNPSVVYPDTTVVISNRITQNNFKKILVTNVGYAFDVKYIMQNNTGIDFLTIVDSMKTLFDPSTPDAENIYKLINTSFSSWSAKYAWIDKDASDLTTSDVSNNSIDLVLVNGDISLQTLTTLWDKVKIGGQLICTAFYMLNLQETVQSFAQQRSISYTFIPSNIPQENCTICFERLS